LGNNENTYSDDQGERRDVRQPRSIIFYAWALVAAQSALAVGVIAFVLVGGARQHTAIVDLHADAQAAELANLTMVDDFLSAQRTVRGYQVTGELGLLAEYLNGKIRFYGSLDRLNRLAGADATGPVAVQASLAERAFNADDQATVAATAGNRRATTLYAQASALSSRFLAQDHTLRALLARDSNLLAARGSRTLDAGQGWVSTILVFGLMVPVAGVAVFLRWVSGPLHATTGMVRRRAQGDMQVRLVPSGPADLRDLALSINFLADEGNRMRAAEADRARVQAGVRQAAIRIRGHLRGTEILTEAVTAVREHLRVDWVYAGIVREGQLTLEDVNESARATDGDMVGYLPPDTIDWLREIYRHRSSHRVQDLAGPDAQDIPVQIRRSLLELGGASLLLTPFGAGPELLGALGLLRYDQASPWTDAETAAVESLARDIGRGLEHARLYEGEEHLVAELKSLDAAKTSFLASASHDLRSPLTSIIGYVEILADQDEGPLMPTQARMLDAVDRNARRLMTLIENMLTTAKIEMGGFMTRRRPVDLAGLVTAAADVIRPAAAAGGLDLEVSCPPSALIVDGDADQLDRVLVNLLSNAVKYTPKGGHVAAALASEGDSAVLTVADTGIGIPAHDQAALFTRFFRASNAVAGAVPGSGLGMSIARTIVTNHEGDISVRSAEGEGTTVTVRIALAKPGVPPARPGRAGDSLPDLAGTPALITPRQAAPGREPGSSYRPSLISRPACSYFSGSRFL
jgi:two-component system phosphate regulon sensor histidine kinase PhoR